MPNIESKLDLSPFNELVGLALEQPEQYNYEVTRDSIRHFAHAVDDYNAVYLDDEFASSTFWKGIVASPGYLSSHGQSAWITSRLPVIHDEDGCELSLSAHAADDWHFLRPVRPGDFVLSTSKLVSAEAKHGKKMGTSVLLRLETRYVNQRGEHVATRGGQYFRMAATRGGAANQSPYPPLQPGQTRNVIQPTRFSGTFSLPPNRRDTHQLLWENVNVGMILPDLSIPPVMLQNLGRYNAATIGTGADEVGGAHGGMPDAYVFGHLRIPWFAQLIVNWGGPSTSIRRLAHKNLQWLLVGFKANCTGAVTGKGVEEYEHWVDLELICQCELGFTTNIGSARVVLPSSV
jgi:acyl dehydratase